MKKQFFLCLILFLIPLFLPAQAPEQDTIQIDSIKEPLPDFGKVVVGLKMSPPFTMKDSYGNYTGVSIDLWTRIAQDLQINYEFKEYQLIGLLDAIEQHKVDLCISPLTVTSERLQKFDFTQPFFTSNLAIAVPGAQRSLFWVFLHNFFSVDFFKVVLLLLLVLLTFGFMLWLAEKRYNARFDNTWKGIGDGIWWAAVTMTTVGYGDKTPISPMGRTIAIIWMFTAIIIISSFTASITTTLTMNKIGSSIENVEDLKNYKVGTVKGSSSQRFLNVFNIKTKNYDTIEQGLFELSEKKIGAFVYDEPILRYLIQHNELQHRVQIVPYDFNSQYYSFSLPHDHKLLDYINPLLMKELESVNWKGILNKYNLEQ